MKGYYFQTEVALQCSGLKVAPAQMGFLLDLSTAIQLLQLWMFLVTIVSGQRDVLFVEDDSNLTGIRYFNVGVLMASNLGLCTANGYNM